MATSSHRGLTFGPMKTKKIKALLMWTAGSVNSLTSRKGTQVQSLHGAFKICNMIDTSIIKRFEGLRLEAYICPAGVPTIGYGTTMYPNGAKVKMGESISKSMAERLLDIDVTERLKAMKLPAHLNDNQKSALVSFAYNVGTAAWLKSTLRKKVLLNSSDPSIRDEFMKWVIAKGRVFAGLKLRRQAEADLYFKPISWKKKLNWPAKLWAFF